MLIFVAILVGILINFYTGGLEFYSTLCVIAGIFVIMPTLLKFNFSDLKIIFQNKLLVSINLIFNFLVTPIIFVGIGYLLGLSNEILYALFLLGILPGGGLLMSWVLNTNGNLKIAFSFFLLNLITFSLLFFPVNNYFEDRGDEIVTTKNITETNQNYFGNLNKESAGCIINNIAPSTVNCFSDNGGVSPITAILVLIFIPFVISRLILLSSLLTKIIQTKIRLISSISTFFIIGYIFSLEQINSIFLVESSMLLNIGVSLFISYILLYLVGYLIYKITGKNDKSNSLFWNISIRFITLGLIFSFIYSTVFGIGFTIVFVLAYFIQIGLSTIFGKIIGEKKID